MLLKTMATLALLTQIFRFERSPPVARSRLILFEEGTPRRGEACSAYASPKPLRTGSPQNSK
jgi:hypothetical protein